MTKTLRRLTGLGLVAVLVGLIALSIAIYNKTFTNSTMVTLYTDSTGNEMNLNADVMVRGVVVGSVRSITSDGDGAELGLAINPSAASTLPANVTAEMVPTTLFGQRYVSLILPSRPSAQTLAQVRVISQDRSADAIEVEQVLNDLEPMLTAVQPQKLAVTLTAVATALEGRGSQLGQTLDTLNAYLKQFNPQLPALDQDIRELTQVSQTYNQAAPGIVRALRDFSVTSQTVADEQNNLSSLYSTVTGASQDLNTFLTDNQSTLINLATTNVATLHTLERYSPEFPCVVQGLVEFIPNINKALGAGTDQPGLHVTIHVSESRSAYKPDVDTPVYGDDLGPHCYSAPFSGISLNDGYQGVSGQTIATSGLGVANGQAENELVNELVSSTVNVPAADLPSWSSVLVGPLYRGTTVTVK
jgi:phospholipid/cholesterol/gamma-HCH transport system substrate-binding protein